MLKPILISKTTKITANSAYFYYCELLVIDKIKMSIQLAHSRNPPTPSIHPGINVSGL